ncbi:uncharacterized protein BYT42DRAFT_590087 [Radiomyces spectabilis]|uniref:uncharacterized protein n=1 Tax=Radiomyces spectabilis TaxID=64574 RepID=UPI00221F727F|nr:uncharacterized protein BYT42DRAFT_590087 [Radiomyces spectabilis]KAI8364696.1 hypothetical protein BYT42DRAFT_590087 [Radiomyces spectabilis]
MEPTRRIHIPTPNATNFPTLYTICLAIATSDEDVRGQDSLFRLSFDPFVLDLINRTCSRKIWNKNLLKAIGNSHGDHLRYHMLEWSVLDIRPDRPFYKSNLSQIQSLSSFITHLNLRSSRVQDDQLHHLSTLINLVGLTLDQTGVTDVGVAHLRRMTYEGQQTLQHLELLNLAGNSGISDVSLVYIKGFPSLLAVDLSCTDVTETARIVLEGCGFVRVFSSEAINSHRRNAAAYHLHTRLDLLQRSALPDRSTPNVSSKRYLDSLRTTGKSPPSCACPAAECFRRSTVPPTLHIKSPTPSSKHTLPLRAQPRQPTLTFVSLCEAFDF